MRKGLLLIFAIASLISAHGQRNLSGGRTTSVNTYVYQLSVSEAKELYRSGMDKFNEKNLHTCIDSFHTTSNDRPELKPGNYLFVYAKGNELSGELIVKDDLQYKLVNNDRDLIVALHNSIGKPITNAEVYINNRRVPLDNDLNAFRISKRKKAGNITVIHEGILHFFPLRTNDNYNSTNTFWNKLAHSFPLKYIVLPIQNMFRERDHYFSYYNDYSDHEKKFRGFMVFSKPIYKPGDTVRLKAFILTKQKKPVNRDLIVRLTERYFETDSVIAVIHPYRPGGYEYEFVVTDSLGLSLDSKYMITLEEVGGKKYNYDDYDGDKEEDEYMLQRKILMRGKFEYEEYELSSVTFSARADKKKHNRGNPVSLYLKATDENEMAVMDGRVEILVTTETMSDKEFYSSHVFIPDTLWRFSQALESIGETRILLPDSIFPAAAFEYTVQCVFLNSNNERRTQTLRLDYDHNEHFLSLEQKNDSLSINQYFKNNSQKVPAIVSSYNEEDDLIHEDSIQLPAQIPINPFASYYEVETDTLYESFELSQGRGFVGCNASRTQDSVFIQMVNPKHLYFWYTLFAGKKVIKRGYTNELFYSEKAMTAKNYFVSVQYVYGDKIFSDDFTAAYQDKLLTITSDQPAFVYPGQTANITLTVTNNQNKPIEDADVTAYGFTKKFNKARAPYVPYLGKYYPLRKRGSYFEPDNEDLVTESEIKLNWERWSKEMGLDSIEYFRFLHTPNIYRNTEPAPDSVTQIAPFVVVNGELQPIHQIYIDEKPIFFRQAQHLKRYSFQVSPGIHFLRLRTNKYMLRVDSLNIERGVKTFICINADTILNKRIRLEKMPDSLTNYEKELWSRYMILVENNFGENYTYIRQSGTIFLLNAPSVPNDNNNRSILDWSVLRDVLKSYRKEQVLPFI